jgi:hypothetical protein
MLGWLFMPVLLLVLVASVACAPEPPRNVTPAARAAPLPTIDPAVVSSYVAPPAVRSFPAIAATVQTWIDTLDMVNIRAHGWDLWESINTPVDAIGTPVWETWFSGHEVFELGPSAVQQRAAFRDFESPVQFHDRFKGTPIAPQPVPGERVTAFNRYTLNLANYIWSEQLYLSSTLTLINQQFDQNNTPVADRKIAAGPIDPQSIALKPVFQFISGTEPTVIPYWAGISPQTTTNLANPEPHTWRQGVVVDPTGTFPVGSTVWLPVNGEPPAPRIVVPLEAFYTILLTADDVANFSQFAETSGDDLGLNNQGDPTSVAALVQPGNIAVMVAMHVTTKEIDNWTWQTFWWAHNPHDPFYGSDRPASIGAPWSNYNMDTAYFMIAPPPTATPGDLRALTLGDPVVAFNPYLETNLTGTIPITDLRSVYWTGVNSNCMSCHRMAAWRPGSTPAAPGLSPPYVPNGQINPDDPLFAGYTKVDFLWSIATRTR